MTTRQRLRRALVSASAHLDQFRDDTKRAVSLCYHSIHPAKPFATVSPQVFERHLAWLTEHCRVEPLGEESLGLLSANTDADTSRPLVFLTFDDGYDDNFDYAFPALMKYGVRATFFLTTGLIERNSSTLSRFLRERNCSPDMLKTLDWGQIREMRSAGMIFGAHTHTHRNLATLDDTAAVEELRLSKAILEDKLAEPIRLMAYPYGKPRVHFTFDRTVPLVRDCGYELAAAVVPRGIRPSDSSFAVPRFFVARDDVEGLREKVIGRADVLGWWQEHAPISVQRLVSPSDFGH
jgi:peptidoglycan/xylan/chitin deacetylase (PgdA/CDA1 family)